MGSPLETLQPRQQGKGVKFCTGVLPALRRLLCDRLPDLEDNIEDEEVEEEDALLLLPLDAGRG